MEETSAVVASMFPAGQAGKVAWQSAFNHAVEQHLAFCDASRACTAWTYISRPIPIDEQCVEQRLCPPVLAAVPKTLRTRAVSNSQTVGLTTDYLLALLLQYAYRGTKEERTKLFEAVTKVTSPQPGDDIEVRLEQWRRRVAYLPRFGIAVPDYGEMITAADRLVSCFEDDSRFCLDRALFVRMNGIDCIKFDDKDLFDKYIEHLVGLVRVAGGTHPGRKGRNPQAAAAITKGCGKGEFGKCKFFSTGLGCVLGKDCPHKNSERLTNACFKCGQLGHGANKCPVIGCEKGKQPKPLKWPPGLEPPAGKGGHSQLQSQVASALDKTKSEDEAAKKEKVESKKAKAAKKRQDEIDARVEESLKRMLGDSPGPVGSVAKVSVAELDAMDQRASCLLRAANEAESATQAAAARLWTFDSGASAVFRPPAPSDQHSKMRLVKVDLALGRSQDVYQDSKGEVVTSGPPIYSEGVAVEEAGFTVLWTPSDGVKVARLTQDEEKDLSAKVLNGDNAMSLEVKGRIPYLTDSQKEEISKHVACVACPLSSSPSSSTSKSSQPVSPSSRRNLVLAALDKIKAKPASTSAPSGLLKFIGDSRATSSSAPGADAATKSSSSSEPVSDANQVSVVFDDHAFTHFPFDGTCLSCVEANKQITAFMRGEATRPEANPTEVMYTMDWCGPLPAAANGHRWMLVIMRVHDHAFYVHTTQQKKDSVVPGLHAARIELGDDAKPFIVHSDQEPVLKDPQVKEYMGANKGRPHFSVPNFHNTNAIAEAAVKSVSRGLRVSLVDGNVHPKYWPQAVRTWVVHRNIQQGIQPRTNIAARVPFGQLGPVVMPAGVLSKSAVAPKAIPAAHFGYDLNTTGGVRILFRDLGTQVLRQTTVLHSNFHPRPTKAFTRTTENLRITHEFCKALDNPSEAGADVSTEAGGDVLTTAAETSVAAKCSAEEAALSSSFASTTALDPLEAAVICRRAFACEDDMQYPSLPAAQFNEEAESARHRALAGLNL